MSAGQRLIIEVLLLVSIGLALLFALGVGWPRRTRYATMAWLWVALALVAAALDVLLMLIVLRVAFPVWLLVIVLFAQNGVWAWRLVALYRIRRDDQSVSES